MPLATTEKDARPNCTLRKRHSLSSERCSLVQHMLGGGAKAPASRCCAMRVRRARTAPASALPPPTCLRCLPVPPPPPCRRLRLRLRPPPPLSSPPPSPPPPPHCRCCAAGSSSASADLPALSSLASASTLSPPPPQPCRPGVHLRRLTAAASRTPCHWLLLHPRLRSLCLRRLFFRLCRFLHPLAAASSAASATSAAASGPSAPRPPPQPPPPPPPSPSATSPSTALPPSILLCRDAAAGTRGQQRCERHCAATAHKDQRSPLGARGSTPRPSGRPSPRGTGATSSAMSDQLSPSELRVLREI